jgi:hypothetical protein
MLFRMIYPDHFYCFGCGQRGSRLDWLMRVEGMTASEAVAHIKDWSAPQDAPWSLLHRHVSAMKHHERVVFNKPSCGRHGKNRVPSMVVVAHT